MKKKWSKPQLIKLNVSSTSGNPEGGGATDGIYFES